MKPKLKITILQQFEDNNDRYIELRINKYYACCVKETANGSRYILECDNGDDLYSYVGGADYPMRKLTDEEREAIIKFVSEVME